MTKYIDSIKYKMKRRQFINNNYGLGLDLGLSVEPIDNNPEIKQDTRLEALKTKLQNLHDSEFKTKKKTKYITF